MEADFVAILLSQSLLLIAEPCLCRWSPYWRGESQEGCREAAGGWDCAGVPAGLSWGGVCRQPPVSWPRSLPAQVWQLVFTLALQECLLQSVLHQISLDTDTGGKPGSVFVHICVICAMAGCMCVWGCDWERNQNYTWENHQRVTKRHVELDFGDWAKMFVPFVSSATPC